VELVGLLLLPAQATEFSIYFYRQAMGASYGDRTRPQSPDDPLRHAEGEQRIVLELSSWDRECEIRRKRLYLLGGNETRQVKGMNSTVGEYRGHARDRWVIAPAHARVIGCGRVGVMSMRKLRPHNTDPTEIAAGNHRARVAYQRVTG